MNEEFRYKYITEAGDTAVKTGRGFIERVIICEASDRAFEVVDEVSGGASSKIVGFKPAMAEGSYRIGCTFANGLVVRNSGAGKITVIFR